MPLKSDSLPQEQQTPPNARKEFVMPALERHGKIAELTGGSTIPGGW